MTPIEFEEQTHLFGANQEGVLPLPSFLDTNTGEVVSCWTLSDEELAEINNRRRVWLIVHCDQNLRPQPVVLTAFKPFVKND